MSLVSTRGGDPSESEVAGAPVRAVVLGARSLVTRMLKTLARQPRHPPNDPHDTSATEAQLALMK